MVSSVVWNRLHHLPPFHDEGAGDIRTGALVGDTAVVHSVLHKDGIFWAGVGLWWTLAGYSITSYDHFIGSIWDELEADVGDVGDVIYAHVCVMCV